MDWAKVIGDNAGAIIGVLGALLGVALGAVVESLRGRGERTAAAAEALRQTRQAAHARVAEAYAGRYAAVVEFIESQNEYAIEADDDFLPAKFSERGADRELTAARHSAELVIGQRSFAALSLVEPAYGRLLNVIRPMTVADQANSTPEPSVGDVYRRRRELDTAWTDYVVAARAEVAHAASPARSRR